MKVKKLETQLNEVRLRDQEREEQITRVMEQNAKLRKQVEELKNAPTPILFPECRKCDCILEQFQYLEEQLFRKDMVIKGLVEERDFPRTRQLFQETREWSVEHFQEDGLLSHVGMGNLPL